MNGGDHYALFALPRGFALDAALLEQRYREVQARVHPDRHAHLSDAEKRRAVLLASQANEAYQTLKQPLARARYLLALAGHDPRVEDNTAMPVDFLVAQMELREAVAAAREARDVDALDRLHTRLLREIKAQHAELARELDETRDYAAAADRVRQLMFQDKLLQDIDDALEAAEA